MRNQAIEIYNRLMRCEATSEEHESPEDIYYVGSLPRADLVRFVNKGQVNPRECKELREHLS